MGDKLHGDHRRRILRPRGVRGENQTHARTPGTEARGARKIARLIRQARFKYKDACVEDIEYPPERKPGRDRIERLASCQWVRDRETLIIIPRHGKREKPRSARPSATPHAAGESPHDTRARRTCPGEIDRARLDGQAAYYRKVDEFKSIDLPVLDDFPATPVNAADSILIFEIMEARSSAGATPGASQCEPEQWYVRSGSELIADSTLSRLTGSARYLEPAWPRHAPTQHHTQRRKRMEGSDRRHQRITLSTKRTAGTIHRLPAVPLIGDPITKNDYWPFAVWCG